MSESQRRRATSFCHPAQLRVPACLAGWPPVAVEIIEEEEQTYPESGGKWQISVDGGQEPVWNPKGGELFYRNGSNHGSGRGYQGRLLGQQAEDAV
jgi:hypothetical protein